MTESNIDLKWEIEKIKIVLLAVFDPVIDEDLTRECYKLYSSYIENYNEVVIFFFRTGEFLDTFVELFLGNNKCEEEDVEDIEIDKLVYPISITQGIGIDNYKLKKFAVSQDF